MVDLKYKILIIARHLIILVLYISHAITFLKKSDVNRYHSNIHFYSLENLGKDMSISDKYKVFRKVGGRR